MGVITPQNRMGRAWCGHARPKKAEKLFFKEQN